MNTEESTPSTTVDNTSDAELTDEVNTLDDSELETETTEAETEETPTTEPEQPKTEPEALIFGKFKTLEDAEKAYKESERAIREKAEYEKLLQAYHSNEEKARLEQEAEARQMGFDSVEARQMNFDVKNFEFLRFKEALELGYAGADYDAAREALSRYQNTLNPADLAEAKQCFDPEAIEKIAATTALYRNQKSSEYQEVQRNRYVSETKNCLEAFAKESGEWLNVEERGSIIAEAINIAGPNADLKRVKELVDKVEGRAIERYQAEQKALTENKTQIEKLQSPAGGTPAAKEMSGDWHELSEEELNKRIDNYFKE